MVVMKMVMTGMMAESDDDDDDSGGGDHNCTQPLMWSVRWSLMW